MTDKEYRQQRARIDRLIKKWRAPLGLHWWRIDVRFSREEQPKADDTNHSCIGTCDADWEYLQAGIMFYLPAVAELNDEHLETCFVHELCHIFVSEMRMWGEKEMEVEKHNEAMHHEERVVTQLANAFIWLREHAFDEGKNSAKRKAKR